MACSLSGSVEAINSSLSAVCLFESFANLYYSLMACWPYTGSAEWRLSGCFSLRHNTSCFLFLQQKIVASFTQLGCFPLPYLRMKKYWHWKVVQGKYVLFFQKVPAELFSDMRWRRGLSAWSMKTMRRCTKHLWLCDYGGQMFFSHAATLWVVYTTAYHPLGNFQFHPVSEAP